MPVDLESEVEGLGLKAFGVPVADFGCVFKCGLKAFVNHTEGVHCDLSWFMEIIKRVDRVLAVVISTLLIFRFGMDHLEDAPDVVGDGAIMCRCLLFNL